MWPPKALNMRVNKEKLPIYMLSLLTTEKLLCFQSFAFFFYIVYNVLEFSAVLGQGYQTLPKVTSSLISANVFKLIKESQSLSEFSFNSFFAPLILQEGLAQCIIQPCISPVTL